MSRHAIDITGQRFGTLTVLERDYEEQNKRQSMHAFWKCKCDCGKIKSLNGAELRTGKVKSCGKGLCYPLANNLIGQQFGKLTVIEYAGKAKDRHLQWKCKCECGTETIVNGNDLIGEHIISCGCVLSYGEYRIAKILSENNIPFIKQKTFPNCRSKQNNLLKFDFYINDQFLLEFDGKQHFEPTGTLFDQYKVDEIQERDNIKNKWCYDNNILLKRIPYTIIKTITLNDILGDKYIYEYIQN